MRRLIINADDFGLSESVNRAIDECMRLKYISSATLMVNMDSSYDAVELAKQHDYMDRVGLHINLTEGSPLTNEMKNNRRFTDEFGMFNGQFHRETRSRIHISKFDKHCVKEEIRAQIIKYKKLVGIEANMHIDSHHHVHTDWAVFSSILPLIDEYDIQSIRISRTLGLKMGGLFNTYKYIYKYFMNRFIRKNCLFCTDEFGGYRDYLVEQHMIGDNAVTELECHPDYEGGALVNMYTDKTKECRDFTAFMQEISGFGDNRLVGWGDQL